MKLISPTGKGIRNDRMGFGHYGASRGKRIHQGTDFVCTPGQDVVCPIPAGKIVRTAKPYDDDDSYSGCVIQGSDIVVKLFYVHVWAHMIGQYVKQGDPVGQAQDISAKYGAEMIPHIHLAIVGLDPEILL